MKPFLQRSLIFKVLFIIAAAVLIGNALAISRSYQDGWILEGLELPFVFFIATYLLCFFTEKRTKYLLLTALLCVVVLSLVPALKYDWYLGVNVDQHRQFALASYVVDNGHVLPQIQWFGADFLYTATPLLHLLFASFSMLTNISLVDAFKFLPVLLSIIYPLATYATIRLLDFPKEKEAIVLRYGLLISSVPIEPALVFLASGSMFGVPLSLIILTLVLTLLKQKSRRTWILLALFSLALVMVHSFSAIQLTLLLIAILILQRFSVFKLKSYLKATTVFFIALITTVWLVFSAPRTVNYLINQVSNIGIIQGLYPTEGVIPARTFELASANILETLKSVAVYDGAHLFLLSVVLIAILWAAKSRKLTNPLKMMSILVLILFALLVFAVGSQIGAAYWLRIPRLASIYYGLFFGLLILFLTTHNFKRKIKKGFIRSVVVLLVAVFLVSATVQLYQCQPLISSANVLSKDLPSDEPLVEVTQVNTIYQRAMISFARIHLNGTIACDSTTSNQIEGHTDNLVHKLTWYYPLSRSTAGDVPYDYFLIHLPGKSGAFGEQAEFRTQKLVVDELYNSSYSIIYTNGESFILANR